MGQQVAQLHERYKMMMIIIIIKCSLDQIHVYTKHGDFDPDNTFLCLMSQEKLLLSSL